MARDFNGTTDRIDYTLPFNTAGQATSYFCWAYFDVLQPTTNPDYIFQSTATGGVSSLLFDQEPNGAGRLQLQRITDGTTLNRISANNVITTGVWTHIGFTAAGNLTASDQDIFVSGVEVTYSTSTSGTGTERPAVDGFSLGGRPSDDARNFNGRIAWAAAWNRTLAAGEIAMLAAGMSPLIVHNGLRMFAPLVGAPHDLCNPNSGTVDGTSIIAHPRVFDMQDVQMYTVAQLAAATSFHSLTLLGVG